jgi:hypothetical protein
MRVGFKVQDAYKVFMVCLLKGRHEMSKLQALFDQWHLFVGKRSYFMGESTFLSADLCALA